MDQTLIFLFKFQTDLKLKNDANQNDSNLYAEEIDYKQTCKKQLKGISMYNFD